MKPKFILKFIQFALISYFERGSVYILAHTILSPLFLKWLLSLLKVDKKKEKEEEEEE